MDWEVISQYKSGTLLREEVERITVSCLVSCMARVDAVAWLKNRGSGSM